jgi:hypothetical protein
MAKLSDLNDIAIKSVVDDLESVMLTYNLEPKDQASFYLTLAAIQLRKSGFFVPKDFTGDIIHMLASMTMNGRSPHKQGHA